MHPGRERQTHKEFSTLSLSAWMTSCPHGSCLGQDHNVPISSWSASSGVYSADICALKIVKFSASRSVFLLSSSPQDVKTASPSSLPSSHVKLYAIRAWSLGETPSRLGENGAFYRKLVDSRRNWLTEKLKRTLAVYMFLTDGFFIFYFSTGRSHWGEDFAL